MPIDPSIVGSDLGSYRTSWDADDVILYHLGLGGGVPQTDAGELEYCLEDRLKVLPSFSVNGPMATMAAVLALEGVSFPPTALLHGEHEMIVHQPLPRSATVTHSGRVAELWDKGKAALLVVEADTCAADGSTLVTNRYHAFIRGEGGFGGEKGGSRPVVLPDREPNASVHRPIMVQQALLYRLCGDKNPMHSDPATAKLGGFDVPLLHGLCTYGMALKAAVDELLGGDVTAVAKYSTRFAQPVFPGETLQIDMWREDKQILLSVGVVGREGAALANTVIDLAGGGAPQWN
ncbi:3-alpha,7-alpha,12-alpha-trihydroxy-5-beta-choles t-24-enoyl-CoA hydratase [Mycobacterium antarcticum]|uniref:MaoC/PaaZ C-terminal domain-containing protein n=1 Tax=Mycolicibacterium sp. TUM20983 TaxID=3023369 RepID=UPI00238601EE|nr:MaoC/PaaZ C-terminal domain-containing protein [Mycolicibacterium sp. TUM20983]GLP76836.1 3-alpha,7-alpha,12-alpha-trihydroxy-5-beta-choles t-24-enoyl-CoA hydratase [Mycolicibacterium sp. TUM20983]